MHFGKDQLNFYDGHDILRIPTNIFYFFSYVHKYKYIL